MYKNPLTGKNHRSWNVLHREIGKALRKQNLRIGEYDEIVGWGEGEIYYPPVYKAEVITAIFKPAFEEEYYDLDRKGRGSCLNHSLYAYDPDQGVAVIQARLFYRRAARHFGATRKTYFLTGRNEITGEFFRHPVSAHTVRKACKKSTDPTRADVVRAVQRWMWEVSESQLEKAVRQGDILIVPEPEPKNAVSKGTRLIVAESHEIRSDDIRINGRCYALNPTLVHIKGQHAPVAVTGWASIRVAREAHAWDFAERIGD